MAVTLSIDLSDTEQTKLQEIANALKPEFTPAEIKQWAEAECKKMLRERVKALYAQYLEDQAASTNGVFSDAFDVDWANVEPATPIYGVTYTGPEFAIPDEPATPPSF